MKKYSFAFLALAASVALSVLWYGKRDAGVSRPNTASPVEQAARAATPAAPAAVRAEARAAASSNPSPPAPPGADHVVKLEDKEYSPDPAEHLQRSRSHIERTVGWLSERRDGALREGRAEDGALLALRMARLSTRLEALRRGEDPDGLPVPRARDHARP